jgi:hypothetical protein
MMHLKAVRTSFEITSTHPKKAGTTVDITFRQREDGDVLAFIFNAGRRVVWEPGQHFEYDLKVVETEMDVKQLADTCIRLSWFPEEDENIRFNFHAVIKFKDGTEIERSFPAKRVGPGEDTKQHTLGLFSF